MEKTKKKFYNDRVDPSQVKILMCFHCGEQFTSNANYQRHIIYEHQAISLCYQIYHNEVVFEKNAKKRIAKESKKNRELKSREVRPEGISQRRATDSKLENYKKSHEYIKERAEARRNARREYDRNRRQEKAMIARAMEKRAAMANELEPAHKRMKPTQEDLIEVKNYVSEPCNDRCRLCEASFMERSGESLVDHYVKVHRSAIKAMNVHLYKDKNFLKTRNSPPGNVCMICNLKVIETSTEYFHHLTQNHLDMLIEKMSKQTEVDNMVIELEMALSNGTLQSVKILIKVLKQI